MASKLNVLVTGATGQQGGHLARELLARGHTVRALTRRPESPAAAALAERGVAIVPGDFEDQGSLERAARGVDTVFAMATPFESGAKAETRDGINIVRAASAAGVSHLVYSSVAGADRATGIPHFDSKFEVEKEIRRSGVPTMRTSSACDHSILKSTGTASAPGLASGIGQPSPTPQAPTWVLSWSCPRRRS